MAAALLGLSCSYSYSDTIYGSTNNAAAGGLNWDMGNVLPPEAGLSVNGVIYSYTVQKDPVDPLKVHVQNENALGEGNIFQETDDWSGLPGSTINKLVGIDNIPGEAFGDGSIETEGVGSVTDANVVYTYKIDTCTIPLSDPSCPGYEDSLYDWLKANGLLDREPSPDDPFYDQWVQASLNRDVPEEEETASSDENEEEEEEDPGIRALSGDVNMEKLTNNVNQDALLAQMAMIPNFESYYDIDLQGGVYNETVVLQDSTLPDNGRAMRSLASDSKHRDIVRLQYDR